jgi:hypothetical protein
MGATSQEGPYCDRMPGVHGIPDDFDPSPFEGAELTNVAFGPFNINLYFYGELKIEVGLESACEHASPDGWTDILAAIGTGGVSQAQSRLMRLLGHTVTEAVVESSERLRLSFDDGQVLTLIDSNAEHESFNVHFGRDLWVF